MPTIEELNLMAFAFGFGSYAAMNFTEKQAVMSAALAVKRNDALGWIATHLENIGTSVRMNG